MEGAWEHSIKPQGAGCLGASRRGVHGAWGYQGKGCAVPGAIKARGAGVPGNPVHKVIRHVALAQEEYHRIHEGGPLDLLCSRGYG